MKKRVEKIPAVIPEGSVRVRCDFCKKYHIFKKGEYYICPKSLSENVPGGWYILESGGEIEQTSHFGNVKAKLGLGI